MLIEFSVDNFRSFEGTETFSMVPDTKYRKHLIGKETRFKLLPSAVFYGANASGKSNFLKAFDFMRQIVLNRCNVHNSTDHLFYDPFLLSDDTENSSSSFQVIFVLNDVKYRYGFDADETTVYSEWLFEDIKGQEAKLFFRDKSTNTFYVNPDRFKEGKNLKCLDNWLFLWKCDLEAGPKSKAIMKWFYDVNLLDGMKSSRYTDFTKYKMENNDYRSLIENKIHKADLSIESFELEKDENGKIHIKSLHKKFNAAGEFIGNKHFDFEERESLGSQKFLFILSPIIDTLENGKILLIDEFDASLHPLICAELVKMFNNPELNKNNAQLIFTSHDTNLLNADIFDYCQIWFAEKDCVGRTHIKSLSSYFGVNKRKKIDEQYLKGIFGAIPNVDDFSEEIG